MTDRRPIFAIFEGGGAKGIAHVGALKALEANNFQLAGVAGTSAGALIAALVAAGYAADDILNPEIANNNILTRYGSSPLELLERGSWTQLGLFERGLPRFVGCVMLGGFLAALAAAPRTALVAARMTRGLGYLSTIKIREFLNYVLRERLLDLHTSRGKRQEGVPDRITFKDLDYETFYPELLPLKVVATNLNTRALVVFDRTATPDVEVADAVSASIAIPLIFQPVIVASHVEPGPFVDGGLVSNFPTWIFGEEKLAFERANHQLPPVPVAGFTLVPRSPMKVADTTASSVGRNGLFNYLTAVVTSSIFGSQAVSQRFIEDLIVCPLQTKLGTLQFDRSWNEFREAYMDGRRCASQRLQEALVIKPDRVKAVLGEAFAQVKNAIDVGRAESGQPPIGHCRANLVEGYGRDSFRVTHGWNMDGDADDRLVIDSRRRGVPEAFTSREPVFLSSGNGPLAAQASYMTKYERALVRGTVRSAICMPMFTDLAVWSHAADQRPKPVGVFCFDSDDDLAADFARADVKEVVAIQAVRLSAALEGGT